MNTCSAYRPCCDSALNWRSLFRIHANCWSHGASTLTAALDLPQASVGRIELLMDRIALLIVADATRASGMLRASKNSRSQTEVLRPSTFAHTQLLRSSIASISVTPPDFNPPCHSRWGDVSDAVLVADRGAE